MFIVLEGLDGCGKGTQAQILVERLKAKLFKYPDRTTPIGKVIDAWLKGEVFLSKTPRPPATAAFEVSPHEAVALQALLLANKIEVQTSLDSALRRGFVVADRYTPSAVAYGTADGLPTEWLLNSHSALTKPDLYVVLDIPVEESFRRRPERAEAYEANRGRLTKAAAIYRALASYNLLGVPVVSVDGTRPVDVVAADVWRAVEHYCP